MALLSPLLSLSFPSKDCQNPQMSSVGLSSKKIPPLSDFFELSLRRHSLPRTLFGINRLFWSICIPTGIVVGAFLFTLFSLI